MNPRLKNAIRRPAFLWTKQRSSPFAPPRPPGGASPFFSAKKTLGGRPTRAFLCLEGQFALPSRSIVEGQRIAGSPLRTDRRANPQNQIESSANAPGPLSQGQGRRSINAVFALVRITGFFLATQSSKQWARHSMDAWPLVKHFFSPLRLAPCHTALKAHLARASTVPARTGHQSGRCHPRQDSHPPEPQ